MTDKERLDIINRIYGEVLEYKNLTWYYTRKNIGVSYPVSYTHLDVYKRQAITLTMYCGNISRNIRMR